MSASRRGEKTPLLTPPSRASGDDKSSKYYFLNKGPSGAGESSDYPTYDGGEVIEPVPEGATEDEFAPRVLSRETRHPSQLPSTKTPTQQGNGGPTPSRQAAAADGGGFMGWLFGDSHHQQQQRKYGEVGTLMKLRKAPIKIEPKVFFANERTFLAWMHLSVILAGASIAILAFAEDNNPYSQLYGVVLLPVAISFIVYSMYQYARRAYMIRNRHPGPYEDTVGPTVLGIMLMISIVAQFAVKLYSLT